MFAFDNCVSMHFVSHLDRYYYAITVCYDVFLARAEMRSCDARRSINVQSRVHLLEN